MAEDVQETRDERYVRQTNEQYEALGRYVQRFELVCQALRHIITFTLHGEGLRNQELAHIILGHRNMTAQVLLDTACAMLTEVHSKNKNAMEIMAHFRRRFCDEIKLRNDYVHGTWLIGWASTAQDDFSEIESFKLNPSPIKGSGTKSLASSVAELQVRIDELEEIEDGFNRLF